MFDSARYLIGAGIALIIAGVVVYLLQSVFGSKGGLLPGDLVFRRGNATFYFPIVTSIVLSVVGSLALYFLFGGRR